MNIPSNLKYTKDHEWVKVEGDTVTVGITDFAQGELGDIVYVEVETVDETLEEGEIFGTVEAVKTVSDLFLPVSGEIIAHKQTYEQKVEIAINLSRKTFNPCGRIQVPANLIDTTGKIELRYPLKTASRRKDRKHTGVIPLNQ